MSPARKLAAGLAATLGIFMGAPGARAVSAPFFSPPAPTPAAEPAPAAPATPAAATPGAIPPMEDLLDLLQNRYLALSEKCRAAVVRVNAASPGTANDAMPTPYVWTGFFISRNGDVITTNANLLQNAMRVWIDYNGVICPAEVAGYDPVTNVGLLHVANPPKNFATLDLTDSPELPPITTMLLAITSKQGQLPGPSAGMVQGYNANFGDQALPTLHLRVDIPDEGGENGSPVLDLHGKLVGIMIGSPRGSRWSLVLPTRAVLRVRDDLLAAKHVAYGRFGFEVETKASSESAPRLVVKSVDYGGPALAAGLKKGDVLRSIGGANLSSDDDLRQAWFYARPGQDIALQVSRDNEAVQLTLHVSEMVMAANPPPVSPTAAPNGKGVDAAAVSNGVLPVNSASLGTLAPALPLEKSSK